MSRIVEAAGEDPLCRSSSRSAGCGCWRSVCGRSWPPRSFAAWIDFPPYAEHLLHDVGAFQIGIAVSLLAALVWTDAKAVALLGFVSAGAIHTVNHGIDLDLGGHTADVWLIGASTVLAAAALVVRIRSRCNHREVMGVR